MWFLESHVPLLKKLIYVSPIPFKSQGMNYNLHKHSPFRPSCHILSELRMSEQVVHGFFSHSYTESKKKTVKC